VRPEPTDLDPELASWIESNRGMLDRLREYAARDKWAASSWEANEGKILAISRRRSIPELRKATAIALLAWSRASTRLAVAVSELEEHEQSERLQRSARDGSPKTAKR
jgi:hypothetical protein